MNFYSIPQRTKCERLCGAGSTDMRPERHPNTGVSIVPLHAVIEVAHHRLPAAVYARTRWRPTSGRSGLRAAPESIGAAAVDPWQAGGVSETERT